MDSTIYLEAVKSSYFSLNQGKVSNVGFKSRWDIQTFAFRLRTIIVKTSLDNY